MTDKDRVRILRREVQQARRYLASVSDFLDKSNTWSEDPESGVGQRWRGLTCALQITRRPRKKKYGKTH